MGMIACAPGVRPSIQAAGPVAANAAAGGHDGQFCDRPLGIAGHGLELEGTIGELEAITMGFDGGGGSKPGLPSIIAARRRGAELGHHGPGWLVSRCGSQRRLAPRHGCAEIGPPLPVGPLEAEAA